MKKAFVLLVLLAGVLMAEGIQWEANYRTAVQQAAKTNKPIFFVLSSHECKWCRHLEATTFSDPKVIAKLNSRFVNVIAYVDDGDFVPNQLWAPGTPTLWFLDTKGAAMFEPIQGSVGPSDFLKATDIVLKTFEKKQLMQQYGNRKK
jgi:thioredoxin-related protein